MKPIRRIQKIAKMFVLSLIAFISLIPFILIFFTSIKERVDALSMPPVWFFVPTLRNYVDLLTNVTFLKAVLNSLVISSAATLIAMVVGVLAGYGFSRFKFQGRGFFTYLILALRMVPSIVFIIPYFVIWTTIRLNDTYVSMILMYLTLCLPLIILMMRSFVVDVPVELEEAAMVMFLALLLRSRRV